MSITSPEELIDFTKNLMGGSAERVTQDGFTQAVTQTQGDVGFSTYPIDDDTICYWAVERMRRHCLYILMVESAHKFQYKQIHIEHRFKHYIQLIEKMDRDWLAAIENNPDQFGSVYSELCHYLEPGFVYDQLGRDITYE